MFVMDTSPQALLAGLANELASAAPASVIANRELSFRTFFLRLTYAIPRRWDIEAAAR